MSVLISVDLVITFFALLPFKLIAVTVDIRHDRPSLLLVGIELLEIIVTLEQERVVSVLLRLVDPYPIQEEYRVRGPGLQHLLEQELVDVAEVRLPEVLLVAVAVHCLALC